MRNVLANQFAALGAGAEFRLRLYTPEDKTHVSIAEFDWARHRRVLLKTGSQFSHLAILGSRNAGLEERKRFDQFEQCSADAAKLLLPRRELIEIADIPLPNYLAKNDEGSGGLSPQMGVYRVIPADERDAVAWWLAVADWARQHGMTVEMGEAFLELDQLVSRSALAVADASVGTGLLQGSNLPPAARDDRSQAVPPDGTFEGGCWLWLNGRRHDLPKGVIYKLIHFMWDRDSARYDLLYDPHAKPYPVFDAAVEPGTIRGRASDANKKLAALGVRWKLVPDLKSRMLTKQPVSDSGD